MREPLTWANTTVCALSAPYRLILTRMLKRREDEIAAIRDSLPPGTVN
jgi:hypothetical protein